MLSEALQSRIDQFGTAAERYLPRIEPVYGPTTDPLVWREVDGLGIVQVLQFTTGNYLSLARDERVIDVTKKGLDEYGMTASSSRWGCGTQDVHVEIERVLAEWQQEEDSAFFFLTTTAMLGLIPNIAEPSGLVMYLVSQGLMGLSQEEETHIFVDMFTHESTRIASRVPDTLYEHVFEHNDMDMLERKLRRSKARNKIIAADGVFSAGGDVAPLPTIVELAEKYGAMVLIDDAHGTGVLGKNGRGTWEHFGVENRIDFKISSCAKALACGFGAFVSGPHSLIHFIRANAMPYIFSGSPPADRLLGMMKAIQIVKSEPERRQRVLANAQYLREGLRARGLTTLRADEPLTPIVPVVFGDEYLTSAVYQSLLKDERIYASEFIFPAVPRKMGRVRFTVMADHTKGHLDHLLSALDRTIERVG